MVQCQSHLKASQSLHDVFMGVAFTECVTDGIRNLCLDKYYFPLLKVVALLFPTFIRACQLVLEPVLFGDAVFMSCCVCMCGTSMRFVRPGVQLLCGG